MEVTDVMRQTRFDVLDVDAVMREVEAGYISRQKHPDADLWILNYTARCQYDWRWNAETMQCRGLIVDGDWNIVARPFPKFFSVEQLCGELPDEPFELFEKVDGSLGIVYHIDGVPHIASRGSFTSEQAVRATKILRRKFFDVRFDPSLTYLVEILYPENRIVVDYGGFEDLVLLAVIETDTGEEREIPFNKLTPIKRHGAFSASGLEYVLQEQHSNREGFVIRFSSGLRVKVKFDEYKRLHKLLTGVSPKAIWELLRSGGNLNEFLDGVPDEFYQWVRETENDLRRQYAWIELSARSHMRFSGNRKDIAAKFKRQPYPDVMFAMLDGKDYSDVIWRKIKPSGPAFRCSMDD